MWIRCVIAILALITRLDGQPAGGKLMGGSESDLSAVYETGMKYFRGGGLRIDHNKAFEHFRHAAEQGLPQAQAELALLYRSNGLFDFLNAADYQQATTWAERALQDGRTAFGKRRTRARLRHSTSSVSSILRDWGSRETQRKPENGMNGRQPTGTVMPNGLWASFICPVRE